MLDFLIWLTNERIGTYIYNRYNQPQTVEELWDRVDNIRMISGLEYEHFMGGFPSYVSCYSLRNIGYFCCYFENEELREEVNDCTEVKKEVPGLQMLKDLEEYWRNNG